MENIKKVNGKQKQCKKHWKKPDNVMIKQKHKLAEKQINVQDILEKFLQASVLKYKSRVRVLLV